jgi:hypothetical protein
VFVSHLSADRCSKGGKGLPEITSTAKKHATWQQRTQPLFTALFAIPIIMIQQQTNFTCLHCKVFNTVE